VSSILHSEQFKRLSQMIMIFKRNENENSWMQDKDYTDEERAFSNSSSCPLHTQLDYSSLPNNYRYGLKNDFFASKTIEVKSSVFEIRKQFNETYPKEATLTSSDCSTINSEPIFRKRPPFPVRRHKTCTEFSPLFPPIPSIESESYITDSKSSFSIESSLEAQEIIDNSQEYFEKNPDNDLLNRSHSLVTDDRIIDVEYDSDTGWKTKSIRSSPFKKKNDSLEVSCSGHERRYSRESLSLNLKDENGLTLKKLRRHSRPLKREETIADIVDDIKSKLNLSQNKSDHVSDLMGLKSQLEGKVVPPDMTDDSIKSKTVRDQTKNIFERCQSKSLISNDSVDRMEEDDDIVDDVFDSSLNKTSIKKENIAKHSRPRKSNSQETSSIKKRNESVDLKSRNSSSISIQDKPKYFDRNSPIKSSNVDKNASSNAIAKPSRGSLKKSSTIPKNSTSSDYDRDRGRSRHMDSGHRESFKKNERTNERNSEQDRASDRDKDGSLNRSLSNTDTNLEDRIGKLINLNF
jgi:hypothetical protein